MTAEAKSFVLFPLGEKRFALPAEIVSEIVPAHRVQNFPHTAPLMSGVLLRRGHIVPVCDIARVLAPAARRNRLCLIATIGNEWLALPISGSGELVSAELHPATGQLPDYVAGLVPLKEEIVEVLDLARLIPAEVYA